MEMDMLWPAALTAGLGLIGWMLRSAVDEMQRISILLNKTREEMAKDYVTKADSTAVMAQIVARFDRIEEKIDRLMER
jgi:CHASE3 domain sensor protein